MNAIDTASDVRPHLSCFKEQGILSIGRYACKSTGIIGKKLEPIEAQAIAAAGFSIFTAWEQGDAEHVTRFTFAQGQQDCRDFVAWAEAVGQPQGSAVYPTVDFDATDDELHINISSGILPYFDGFLSRMTIDGVSYRLGVYGSWAVCQAVKNVNLVSLTWLAGAKDWRDYEEGSASGLWTIRQSSGTICDLPGEVTDLDDVASDIGAWVPVGAAAPSVPPTT